MIKVTDCERIAEVTPTALGQFNCPKCLGVCNPKDKVTRMGLYKMWSWMGANPINHHHSQTSNGHSVSRLTNLQINVHFLTQENVHFAGISTFTNPPTFKAK